ncbi:MULTISPECIES: hypothetical protein [unclassified Streptomyces]|uniref:hypothetical protein n=1 Tax=unclassified Streptomyces TaxID=2593676 RepID=UPI00382D87A3
MADHETTTNFLGNAALALVQRPAELDRIRKNPDAVPAPISRRSVAFCSTARSAA